MRNELFVLEDPVADVEDVYEADGGGFRVERSGGGDRAGVALHLDVDFEGEGAGGEEDGVGVDAGLDGDVGWSGRR
jgi:hypothetical protein